MPNKAFPDDLSAVALASDDYFLIADTSDSDAIKKVAASGVITFLDGSYLNLANTTPFTPSADYHPATKKYVDEAVATANEFTELTDTPANYTSAAGKIVRVNSTPDGLEFVSLTADLVGAGALDIGENAFTVNSIEIVGSDGEVNKAAVEDSSNWDDAYGKRVDTWGDGLSYSSQTASVDYNTTNLKITANQLDTIQSIATTANPTFASLTLENGATFANAVDNTVTLTENSDVLSWVFDGTDIYQKWSNGGLYLMTDEGTNTVSNVYIKGKGTSGASLALEDGNSSNNRTFFQQVGTVAQTTYSSATTEFVFNQAGADVDHRFAASNAPNAFVIRGSDGEVSISEEFVVGGSARFRSNAAQQKYQHSIVDKSYVDSLDTSDVLNGNLTHIDSDDQGDQARGVWGDGKFIYLANHTGGLHTYSVSDTGMLTHIDSDDQGDEAFGVWGDGKFIYLANYTGGLHTYSVDKAYGYDKGVKTHTFKGGVINTPDEITATSDGVAASLETVTTEITTNGDSDLDNVTLANGVSGQIKHFVWTVAGNAADTLKITPATTCGSWTQITFGAGEVGDGCTMIYSDSEGWSVIGNNGGTIA